MRSLSQTLVDNLYIGTFIGDYMPLVRVTINEIDYTNVTNFSCSREMQAYAQSISLTLVNTNPADATDNTFYNWQGDTLEAETIVPGAPIKIEAGYGADLVTLFTGTIDTIHIKLSSGDSTISINARDTGAKLVDGTIMQDLITDTGPPVVSEEQYFITYPIQDDIVQIWLSDKENPYLWEIFKDVCIRAGISTGDLAISETGLQLDDLEEEHFEELSGTWSVICNKIAELLDYGFYCDEDGKIHLAPKRTTVYEYDSTITLTGTTPVALDVNATNKDRAINSSIVVGGGIYLEGEEEDWVFDEKNNTLVRTTTSSIPSGVAVDLEYSYANFIFREGLNLVNIEQWVTFDDYYYKLVARNVEEGLERSLIVGDPKTYMNVNGNKILVVDLPMLITNTQLDNWLTSKRLSMRQEYYQLSLEGVSVPHLQVYDLIQAKVTNLIQGIYRVTGINTSYTAGDGFSMSYSGVFFNNP